MNPKSIKSKIGAVSALVILAGIVVVVAVMYMSFGMLAQERARSELRGIGNHYAEMLDVMVEKPSAFINTMAAGIENNIANRNMVREQLQRFYLNVLASAPFLDNFYVIIEPNAYDARDARFAGTNYGTSTGNVSFHFSRDRNTGEIAFRNGVEPDESCREMPYYTVPFAAEGLVFTEPHRCPFSGKTRFTVSRAVIGPGYSGPVGVMGADVFMEDLFTQIDEHQIFGSGYLLITSSTGRVVYSPIREEIGHMALDLGLEYRIENEPETFFNVNSALNGRRSLAVTVPVRFELSDAALFITVVVPLNEIHAESNRILLLLVAMLAVITVILIAVVYIVTARSLRPIGALVDASNKISEGRFDFRLPAHTDDELGLLAGSFERMAENIRQAAIARENSAAKSRFLARMSHEIRTPLTAVMGISEIQLQDSRLEPAVEEAFAKIHNSADLLLRLVNDILDMSKIEAGKLTLLEDSYDVADLIIDVTQLHLVYAGSKEIEFIVNVDENLPATLVGDELRIRQIMSNLLSNAFKYTESGRVEFALTRREPEQASVAADATGATGEAGIILELAIRDTGYGMNPEQLQNLAGEYMRYHEKEHRFGAGLGMPIVYSLVDLMGAHINVESEVGAGTFVLVRIPQAVPPAVGDRGTLGAELADSIAKLDFLASSAARRSDFRPEPMPYGKVLVVDDIDTNLYVAKGLLQFYELSIETCTRGTDAVAKIQAGKIYDIIFMDHMMPGLDGIETTEKLRELGYTKPIVAMTANALLGQAEAFMEHGFDGFIYKPIRTTHLNGILCKFIRGKQPAAVREEARGRRPVSPVDSVDPIDIEDFVEREMTKLRQDFLHSQKNAASDIQKAIAAGDIETAHRLAHTLKGLAGLIKEERLAKAALQAEQQLREKIVSESALAVLGEELELVLSGITAPQTEIPKVAAETFVFGPEHRNLLERLEKLLAEHDIECMELIPELNKLPKTEELTAQMRDYAFGSALVTVRGLRDCF